MQSWTNRACWRASSAPAKAVIQTTSETGRHCVSIYGSPSHETVAISNHSMRGEPSHWKRPAGSGTAHEVSDFWESAESLLAAIQIALNCGVERDFVSIMVFSVLIHHRVKAGGRPKFVR